MLLKVYIVLSMYEVCTAYKMKMQDNDFTSYSTQQKVFRGAIRAQPANSNIGYTAMNNILT